MRLLITTILLILFHFSTISQVSINTNNLKATLDVNGDVAIREMRPDTTYDLRTLRIVVWDNDSILRYRTVPDVPQYIGQALVMNDTIYDVKNYTRSGIGTWKDFDLDLERTFVTSDGSSGEIIIKYYVPTFVLSD